MKKLLVALLLIVSSVLSFGAEKVPYEKLSFSNGYIYYNNQEFTGEFEKKDPNTGIVKMVASVKNGKLDGMSYTYDEIGRLIEETPYKNGLREGTGKVYYKSGVVANTPMLIAPQLISACGFSFSAAILARTSPLPIDCKITFIPVAFSKAGIILFTSSSALGE